MSVLDSTPRVADSPPASPISARPEELAVAPTAAVSAKARTGGRSLLVPIGGVTLIMLVCKVVGFTEKIIVAHFLGTSHQADGYYVAFGVVWAAVFILREVVQPSFLPVYVQHLCADGSLAGRIAAGAGSALAALVLVGGIGLAIAAPVVVRAAAPGFDEATSAYTAGLLRGMSLGAAVLAFMGFSRTLLNAHHAFCWAAFGELVFRVVTVGGLTIGFFMWRSNWIGPCLAIGALAGLLVHFVAIRKHAGFSRPSWDKPVADSGKQMLLLAAPLIFGVLCSHFGQLIDSVFASTLSAGRVSALSYARKLTDAIVLLGPAAVATVMFAHFGTLAAEGRLEEVRAMLVRALRILLMLSTPVALLVVSLRTQIVEVLFQHGQFGSNSTALTASALAGYGLGIVAFSIDGLLVGTFYATKDTRTPVIIGIVGVAMDTMLAWLLMGPLDHLGIALAISITRTLKVSVLAWVLSRRLGIRPGPAAARLCAGMVLGTVLIALLAAGCTSWLPFVTSSRMTTISFSALIGLACFLVFAFILWITGVPEMHQAVQQMREWVQRRDSGGLVK